MSSPHATVFLFVFLLASPSHAHARAVPDDGADTNSSGDVPATAPPADTPANGGAAGRSRTLWSTPSDGVGH
ncbi:hypothetical protein BRADI_4g27383v3 [Brachypodium distachyon]|uniref:Uncharacterized protein n=1 Tax=Brachypodium distachyon TaxID=15368 RepID=A0A0Q3HNM2_BRADI|nr:hypothetical protein BRADI_4g27383v3 [Brachypodium distachyon]